MSKISPHVTFGNPPSPPGRGGGEKKERHRPIAEGRLTRVVVNESLPTNPTWSAPAALSWGICNSFRWTHHLLASEDNRKADSQKVHKWLTLHQLTSGSRCLTTVDMETFNRLNIWSEFWWITEHTVEKLIVAINQSHHQHDGPRRETRDVIHSALFEY